MNANNCNRRFFIRAFTWIGKQAYAKGAKGEGTNQPRDLVHLLCVGAKDLSPPYG